MVRTTRSIAGIAALLLLLGGCSDPQGTEPGDAVASESPGEATSPPGDGGKKGSGKGDQNKGGDARPGKPGGKGGPNGGPGNGSKGGDGGDDFSESFGEGVEGGVGPDSAPYPAEGEYVYAQEGFEEFCQGGSCDKQQLPSTQSVDVSYSTRSGDTATVVTKARSSDRQTVTTTTRWSPGQALVTKVVLDFTYGSFDFSQTYEPQPAVEMLQFPLKAGKKWSGRWDARTSGDYKARVVAAENFEIDDKPTRVYKIALIQNFKGEFTGRAQTTIWLDARTRSIIKTDGKVAVASSFGEYTSNFETVIQHGPGY